MATSPRRHANRVPRAVVGFDPQSHVKRLPIVDAAPLRQSIWFADWRGCYKKTRGICPIHSAHRTFVVVGATPVYTKAYGWLDASIGYRVNDHLSLGIEGTNLLSTMRESYYGVETRPQNYFINDLQILGSVTLSF
jgi:hypothetical protein